MEDHYYYFPNILGAGVLGWTQNFSIIIWGGEGTKIDQSSYHLYRGDFDGPGILLLYREVLEWALSLFFYN
jgi:hypothetical protein